MATPRRRSSGPSSTPPTVLEADPSDWISLTELGRLYGVSAMQAGRMLCEAGLRHPGGEPTARALNHGLAQVQHPHNHRQTFWNRRGCSARLERQGLLPMRQQTMVGLWVELLSALQQGCPWISVTAEEMADEMPRELVAPVNRELRERGLPFQVSQRLRRGEAPRPASSPVPATCADDPRRCD